MADFPYFAFIDESGVLSNDPNQPFFALGLLLIEDTSEMTVELNRLKARVLKAFPHSKKGFEFKFKNVTRDYRRYYEELIDIALAHPMKVCVFILDKTDPRIDVSKYFKTTWDAYIGYSKLLIRNNVKHPDSCIVIADHLTKPTAHPKWLEHELRNLARVNNAMMLESSASMFIQVIDVLTGCVVYAFRRRKNPRQATDKVKQQLSEYLASRLGRTSLDSAFTIRSPISFNVWLFKAK
jgi:hypothetical protein